MDQSSSLYGMDHIFLYQQWLDQRICEYVQSPRPPKLKGREIVMSPKQYGAALLQAYLGKASLSWIAKHANVPLQLLRQWRQEPEFLLVMDWSKSLFSKSFQEKLILNDYSVAQCHFISGEISLLEESWRVSTRGPLYQRFAKLGTNLISKHKHDLPLENYDIRLFRRLFLFFLTLEYHWPSPARYLIDKDFIPLAKDVIWPRLNAKDWIGPHLESMHRTTSQSQIRRQLDNKLTQTFQRTR